MVFLLTSMSYSAFSNYDVSEIEKALEISITMSGGKSASLTMISVAISDCSDAIQAEGQSRNGTDGWKWTSFGKHFSTVDIEEKIMTLSGREFQLIYGSSSPFRYEDQEYTCSFKYDADEFTSGVVRVSLDRLSI